MEGSGGGRNAIRSLFFAWWLWRAGQQAAVRARCVHGIALIPQGQYVPWAKQ